MNFLDLCQRLVQETGIADGGPATVTGQTGDMARVVDWINDSWLKIQSMRADWNWAWGTGTATLNAGAYTIALPSTVETIKRVSLGQSYLRSEDYNDFADAYRFPPCVVPMFHRRLFHPSKSAHFQARRPVRSGHFCSRPTRAKALPMYQAARPTAGRPAPKTPMHQSCLPWVDPDGTSPPRLPPD